MWNRECGEDLPLDGRMAQICTGIVSESDLSQELKSRKEPRKAEEGPAEAWGGHGGAAGQ